MPVDSLVLRALLPLALLTSIGCVHAQTATPAAPTDPAPPQNADQAPVPKSTTPAVPTVIVPASPAVPLPPAPPAETAPTKPAKLSLKPGEYLWMPELAPQGPVVIVVSLPEQMAYVYRNGIRIGVSTISSGKKGNETPTGVFTILQKRKEHYSNLYNNAPMPYMQRLTWDGIALHAGKLPGYPASHGCVRLPKPFAEKLFAVTDHGMTVVVADEASTAPTVAYPGLFAPVDPKSGQPRVRNRNDNVAYEWVPERAPEGPLTLVLSTRDMEVVVLRGGVAIGRGPMQLKQQAPSGTRAYVLLDGQGESASVIVPERQALRWLAIPVPGVDKTVADDFRMLAQTGGLSLHPRFAQQVYDALKPGTTVVVTDESMQERTGSAPVLETEPAVAPVPTAPH